MFLKKLFPFHSGGARKIGESFVEDVKNGRKVDTLQITKDLLILKLKACIHLGITICGSWFFSNFPNF